MKCIGEAFVIQESHDQPIEQICHSHTLLAFEVTVIVKRELIRNMEANFTGEIITLIDTINCNKCNVLIYLLIQKINVIHKLKDPSQVFFTQVQCQAITKVPFPRARKAS